MKTKIVFALIAAGFAGLSHAGIAEARKAFEREFAEPFQRASLVDCEVAAPAVVIDKAPGAAHFRLALPYAQDARLRFLTAEFKDGKFVSAQSHVLGLEPADLKAEAFERLRDGFPMVSVRIDVDEVNPVAVLYPARSQKPEYVQSNDQNLDVNPVSRRLGGLGASIGRLGLPTGGLAYHVTLVGKDGAEIDLGVASPGAAIRTPTVMAKIRESIEKREPARKGQVSDRDVVDYNHGSTVRYQAERR